MAQPQALKRDESIYMAKVCEQTERFDDMLDYMKRALVDQKDELTVEERNLLSVAYKNSVGTRRTAWRVISSIETKEEAKNSPNLPLLRDYKAKIEAELDKICNEIIKFLDEKLISSAKDNAQSKVFYLKMKGDYFRYIAEYATGDKHAKAAESAYESYKLANEIATDKLETTNPIRLGLALNFSVFYYEVRNDPKQACQLAKQAFDDAIADIEKIEEENYKDSTTIMQLIRDNLTLWTTELEHGDGEGGDE
jgi:14-3-3 protein epsilon